MSTVTVVPTVELSNVPPRVRLDVTDTGSSPAITSTTVTRLDANGRTVPVRTNDGQPLQLTTSGSTRVGLLYDYEVPYGAAASFSTLESPTVVSAQVTVSVSKVWLVHVAVPSLSMPIELRADSLADETFTVNQGVFWPMGRANPVIVTDGIRKGPQSSLTVGIETAADVRAIRAVIQDGGTLFLNIPPSLGFLFDSCYIAVGDVKRTRISTIGADPYRDVVMPFNVVDRPAGGSQSQRTLIDLLSFSTLDAIRPAYTSLNAVLAGP